MKSFGRIFKSIAGAPLLALGLIGALSCGNGGADAANTESQHPVITTFSPSPSTITTAPQTVVLRWTVSGADSLSISPGIGTVTGNSKDVTVTRTTTFTLTATNASGDASSSTQVTLVPTGTQKIAYLHHSTGGNVWEAGVPAFFTRYNSAHSTNYLITERAYPDSPYPWENYPYDYWNLWVNPSGPANDSNPNVHSLTKLCSDFDVIVFKHCFPVSGIGPDSGSASVSSSAKQIQNYKLQYNALKTRMHDFPATKFIVWTGAALTSNSSDAASGQRARDFFTWVKHTWDVPGDNIFVWDFFELETEGANFLKAAYATGDSHPNPAFCATVAPYIGTRIVDVIEGRGDSGSITGH